MESQEEELNMRASELLTDNAEAVLQLLVQYAQSMRKLMILRLIYTC